MSGTLRTRVFQSPVALVELIGSDGGPPCAVAAASAADFQVVLPYRGLFILQVGCDEVVGDANQVLFISGGESYRLNEPLGSGYAGLLVTPSLGLLADLAQTDVTRMRWHPLFLRRRRRAHYALHALRARFVHGAGCGHWDPLAADDLLLALLRSALEAQEPVPEPCPPTGRLIRRTKEFVEAHLGEPINLADAGRAVGASPSYLTDVFRRFEGLPLHQYLLQARLARALVELPHASDLTTLALDLGFSSHSHFTTAFRRAYGCTPSAFRESMRSDPGGARLRDAV